MIHSYTNDVLHGNKGLVFLQLMVFVCHFTVDCLADSTLYEDLLRNIHSIS